MDDLPLDRTAILFSVFTVKGLPSDDDDDDDDDDDLCRNCKFEFLLI